MLKISCGDFFLHASETVVETTAYGEKSSEEDLILPCNTALSTACTPAGLYKLQDEAYTGVGAGDEAYTNERAGAKSGPFFMIALLVYSISIILRVEL